MELVINDRIRNRKVSLFNSFNISLKYNAVASTFALDFYFDPDVIEQKEMACVGHMHLCKLSHNGELLMTAQILSEAFTSAGNPPRTLVPISGYSLPGVLEDCQVPTNKAIDEALSSVDSFGNAKTINLKLPKTSPAAPYCYPIQDEKLSLRQIATKYIAPFNLQMVVDPSVAAEMDQPFPETDLKPKDTIKHYLTELATQKNINLTHDEHGRLVFTRVKTKLQAVLDFDVPKGGLPGVRMNMSFDGQQMHSQITVVKQAGVEDENAGEFTVTNPFVPFVFRPKTIIQSSGNDIDTELAAKNALADELKNLKFKIAIDRWDVNSKLIKPANVITVKNPEIYLYKKTTLFIESIDYTGNQKEMTAVLNCCLPEVYNGQTPEYLFKGINLH